MKSSLESLREIRKRYLDNWESDRASVDARYMSMIQPLDELIKKEEIEQSRREAKEQIAQLQLDFPGKPKKPKAITKALGLTSQEMALMVLRENPRGLSALEILAAINQRWELGLVRSSLSPQLSRLKAAGRISVKEGIWRLPGKQ